MPTPCPSGAAGRQRGASAIEFTLVAIPMLLAGLGAIELGRWFFVKQAVSLALLEAGRAGITDHARPEAIEAAFERALLPLFPATATQSAAQRQRTALARRRQASGAPAWQIQVLSPDAALFHDFSSPRVAVANAGGLAAIDNNYQAEQHQGYIRRGWPEGRGPVSGGTIFDANSLVLRLSYMHEPLVPGMRALMALLAHGSNGHAQAAWASGHLPMRQVVRLAMQSHPVAWPNTNQKVFTGAGPAYSALAPAGDGPCHGLWCTSAGAGLPAPGASSNKPETPFPPRVPAPAAAPPHTAGPPLNEPAAPAPPSPAGAEPPGDELGCGIVLCCAQG